MLTNIISSIICSQFESQFCPYNTTAPDTLAMQVKFSLDVDYDTEDGYRHLTFMLSSAGSGRYVGVYAKLDWCVTDRRQEYKGSKALYVEGETPWVLLCYHDSCWRGAVADKLFEYRDKLGTIDSLFNGPTGWYKSLHLSLDEVCSLRYIRLDTPGYGNSRKDRVVLENLNFTFKKEV